MDKAASKLLTSLANVNFYFTRFGKGDLPCRSSQTCVASVGSRLNVRPGSGLVGRVHRRSVVALLATLLLIALGGAWSPAGVTAQAPPPRGGGIGGTRHTDLVLTDFVAEQVSVDTWLVSGRVSGCAQLGGMTVQFGGLGAGQQTGTGSDGTFLLVLVVSPTVSGDVTAVATCTHGSTSNTATYEINNF